MLSQSPQFLVKSVHTLSDNNLKAKLDLEGAAADNIENTVEKDEKNIERVKYFKELIDQQRSKLRTGGKFDEGNIIDSRWAIIANLARPNGTSNDAFKRGINKVKDLYTARICIQKLLAFRSSSDRFSGVAEREINIPRQLKHPNIVKLVGYDLPEH